MNVFNFKTDEVFKVIDADAYDGLIYAIYLEEGHTPGLTVIDVTENVYREESSFWLSVKIESLKQAIDKPVIFMASFMWRENEDGDIEIPQEYKNIMAECNFEQLELQLYDEIVYVYKLNKTGEELINYVNHPYASKK